MLSVLLTACSLGGSNVSITCDGFELNLGKTTVAELKEAGFTNLYSHIDSKKIDSMSWENFYAIKGDLSYGTMLAANKKSTQIEFDKGVIFEISIAYDDPEAPVGAILVNGTDFNGCTREEIKAAMGDTEITLDTDEYLSYESGRCEYTFSFKDGSETVTGLRINDGTEKEFSMR